MAKKTQITATGMVSSILYRDAGLWYSYAELQMEVEQEFDIRLCRQSIYESIEDLRQSNHRIAEKEERRGPLKLPLKLFSITIKT
jgi:hypothetical protein